MADLMDRNCAESASGRKGVALVTGGRRGIGRAVCCDLARRGFDVAFVDVVDDDASAQTLIAIEAGGARGFFRLLDIARLDEHQQALAEIEAALGPVTCLVNNAGVQVSHRGDFLDVDEVEFDRLVGVNLKGTFFLTQAVARRMLGVPAENDRSIITVTSANAHLASPEKGAYCVSKAGLSMAMQNFALHLGASGIRVHEIRPGLIQTDMTAEVFDSYSPGINEGRLCALRRWGRPDDIAAAIGALAEGSIPYSTGDIYNVGGGMHIPRL